MATLAERVVAWHQRRFPEATEERVALKLAEEVGELAGAVIARCSGTEHPERAARVAAEAADVWIVLTVLLGRYHPDVDLTGEIDAKLAILERRMA